LYKFRSHAAKKGSDLHVNLFGSGAIMNCALRAQEILAEQFGVSSDVWSATSYTQLRREALELAREKMLNPTKKINRKSHLETVLEGAKGPFIAASDYVRAHSEQIAPFMPGPFMALGTDGMGRSETREALRRHFEVDAECITIAALYQLAKLKQLDYETVAKAIKDLGVDPEKAFPLYA
jgi:pyruvate dehydrogenase E1 component